MVKRMSLVMVFAFGVLVAAATPCRAQELADFSRLSKAINREIAIVDQDGVVREGTLTLATDEAVTIRFGSGEKIFPRASVMSAERMRDGTGDGALKGAVFGALLGLLSIEAYPDDRASAFLWHVAIYSGIGYLFDAGQTHRQPMYRAPASMPAAPKPNLSLSFRF